MQGVFDLTDEMASDIEAMRTLVKSRYAAGSGFEYETVDGKLKLLDSIISSSLIDRGDILGLHCLGVVLGDAMAQAVSLVWVSVNDAYGSTPALLMPGTSFTIFPLTMILKRIHDGEVIDIYALFNGLIKKLVEVRDGK